MMYSYVLSFKLIGITTEIPDGAKRTRTADPLHAMQVLYQLSYDPILKTTVISINLRISFVTVVIPIVLIVLDYLILHLKMNL